MDWNSPIMLGVSIFGFPIQYLMCIVLMAVGHLVRDGWPPTGNTNFGSRPIGGIFCIFGCMSVFGAVVGGLLGLSVLIGFWLDQKHGEGHRARSWGDAGYLAISGITSVAFTTGVAAYMFGWAAFVILALGVIKPAIWNFYWHLPFTWPNPSWWQPTRMSAITFGACFGGLLAFMHYLTQVPARGMI